MCLQIFIQDPILLAVNSQRVQIFLGRRKKCAKKSGEITKAFCIHHHYHEVNITRLSIDREHFISSNQI